MRALVKVAKGYNQMVLKKVERPQVTGKQVLVKVAYTGICGTDIHCYKGEYDRIKPPLILGHEFSGIVEEIGSEVTQVSVGDRVTSETTFSICGNCAECLNKEYNLCAKRQGIGTQVDGSFAEYVLSREESIHILADSVSLLEASICEPLACGVHATMEKVKVNNHDTIIVVGPGPIGLGVVQIAKSMGAKVILLGTTLDAKRLASGEKLGADYTFDTQTEDVVKEILSITEGKGADYLFECSGAAPVLLNIFDGLKQKGTVVQLGVFSDNINRLDMNSIVQREMSIIGSRSQKPSSWRKTLDLMTTKKINSEQMITRIEPLANWQEAIDSVIAGTEIKVVLQPNIITE